MSPTNHTAQRLDRTETKQMITDTTIAPSCVTAEAS